MINLRRAASWIRALPATLSVWADMGWYALHGARRPIRYPRVIHDPRRLLFLCRSFPPVTDGGVYRAVAIANAAAEAGWQVTVLAGPVRDPPSAAARELVDQVAPGVTIARWAADGRRPMWRVSPHLDGGFTNIRAMIRAAAGIAPPDLVVASGPTFSEFVAARVVAAHHGVPYLLDYRDEWTESAFGFVGRGLMDRRWERFALAGADTVVCTAPSAARHYQRTFGPVIARPIEVIMNGWDRHPERPHAADTAALLRRSIGFYGLLSEEISRIGFERFADDLERVLALHPELAGSIRFRFAGRKSPAYQQRLTTPPLASICDVVDHLPASEAAAEMRLCRALLLLNGAGMRGRIIAGKTFGYIAAGRPILLYGTSGDAADVVMAAGGACPVTPGDPEQLLSAVVRLMNGELDAACQMRSARVVEGHSRAARTRRYLALFDAIINDRPAETR
ncbi:MAG: glycosyltransferase [Gemmatimonadales bacterium]